ncbi:MAG: sensor hybrid histidine kinase [Bryobacterales bacterium]|nr:sensor hybrid histidine kinase [Bryobacterales bacterium]
MPVTEVILVVDDEPSDLDMARNSLENLGYRVLTAGDAQTAVRMYRELDEPIALLIADVAMAPVNGCDLALQLTAKQPDLKVLFISGYTGAEVLRRDGIPGLNAAFLRKPFTASQLARQVGSMVEQKELRANQSPQ